MADDRHRDLEGLSRKERRGARVYLIWILIALALIFVLQNTGETNVKFLFAETSLPLFFALVLALALGMAIGYLAPRVRRHEEPREKR
jgi:uncharacterized integral membrane protein